MRLELIQVSDIENLQPLTADERCNSDFKTKPLEN